MSDMEAAIELIEHGWQYSLEGPRRDSDDGATYAVLTLHHTLTRDEYAEWQARDR
jgi:hypothetical protein